MSLKSYMKFTPCENCDNGYIEDDIEATISKCSCLLNYQRNRKLSIELEKSNVPLQISSDKKAVDLIGYSISEDYVGKDKQGNIPKIKKFISNFDERYSSLNMYFYGDQGVQKSTLARVICRELIKKGKSCYFILADDLIKTLIDAERDDELKSLCNHILNVDFLVIDELDESKITCYKSGYQIPFLTTFLKKRIERLRKSTLFCSNREIDNMGNFLVKLYRI